MKTKSMFGSICLMLLGLAACTNESDVWDEAPAGAVRFTGSVVGVGTRVNSTGDAWTGGEHVGIYMVGENDFAPVGGADNKEYTVQAGGAMSPADATHLFYPTDGSKVRFAAYYPYATVSNHIYKVDLTAAGEHDLLYAAPASAYDKANTSAVALQFKHQLSMLTLTVKTSENADATGITGHITRATKADFDLSTGTMSNLSASQALAMTANGATLQAIVLPGKLDGRITFAYDGKSYTWDLANVTLEAGTNHVYNITLKGVAGPAVEASLVSSIAGWVTINANQDVHQDADTENPDPGTPETPTEMPPHTSNVTGFESLGTTANPGGGTIQVGDGEANSVLKLGNSSAGASWTSAPIGAGMTKLSFYAIGWAAKTGQITVSIDNAGTIGGEASQTVGLVSAGANTANPYQIAAVDLATQHFTYTLEGVTDQTTLTFTSAKPSGGDARCLVWGINVE